ncbi:MAG: hypothetical protein ABSF54_21905 [Bryobacteraceae bacterium]|jgi:hypothetical protein
MAEPGQDGQSAAEDLVKSLRAVVREEMGGPPQPPRPAFKPTGKDVLWLVILAGDAALLTHLFPEDAKGPLEFLKDFLPWLLGGTFVVLNDWFRDHLLSWSRKAWVRAAQAALLVIGIALLVKTVPITPNVKPDGTEFAIDDKPRSASERTWLTIHSHTITLAPGQGEPQNAVKRTIELSWWQIVKAGFLKDSRDWRRVYKTDIDTPENAHVTIRMLDGNFDDDFLDPANLHRSGLSEPRGEEPALTFESSGTETTDALLLPWGRYSIAMEGCKPEELTVAANARNYKRMNPCEKLP